MDSEQVYVVTKGRHEKGPGPKYTLRKLRFRWAKFRTTHCCQIKRIQNSKLYSIAGGLISELQYMRGPGEELIWNYITRRALLKNKF